MDNLHEYGSAWELMEAASNDTPLCAANAGLWHDHKARSNARWYGLTRQTDFNGVRRIVNEGWADGVERITPLIEQIEVPDLPVVRRRPRWADQGDNLSMDRVWSGQLDQCWRTARRSEGRGPSKVRVVLDVCVSSGTDSSVIFWRGAAAVALTQALTEAGHNVEVVTSAYGRSTKSRETLGVWIVAKEGTQPIDTATLAAMTALPAFFRSVMLSWKFNHYRQPTGSGCSFVVPLTQEGVTRPDVDHTFLASSIHDLESAQAWIADACAQVKGEEQ